MILPLKKKFFCSKSQHNNIVIMQIHWLACNALTGMIFQMFQFANGQQNPLMILLHFIYKPLFFAIVTLVEPQRWFDQYLCLLPVWPFIRLTLLLQLCRRLIYLVLAPIHLPPTCSRILIPTDTNSTTPSLECLFRRSRPATYF